MNNERQVVIASGVRTAIADFGGSLRDMPPTELAGLVVAEAVKRSPGLAGGDIGHCVMGSVTHSDRRDMYMGRVAALKGRLPIETPASHRQPAVRFRPAGSGVSSPDDPAGRLRRGGGRRRRVHEQQGALLAARARFGARMGDGVMEDAMMAP